MKCAKSIDELYEEVSEYSLVITTDAALATALNGRIDRPYIGHFAMTPKQIAAKLAYEVLDVPIYSELQEISTISDETGYSLKYVHSELENIKEIRKYTADVRKHLHTKMARDVYDSYEALPTLERVMRTFVPEDSEFYTGEFVAVIGDELFNDLDKHFIPLDYDPISIFKGEDYEIDTIYEVGNDRQLAENAVDLIDPSKPTDYAIVLNTASPIADAVRASLYRKELPFINSLNVRDLSQIRDYLQFITLAMEFDTIRVKHVKELFSNYNGFFKRGREEFLLCKQTEADMMDRSQELWGVMRNIHDMTFGEVCSSICDSRAKIQVGILIKDLDVVDRKVTSKLLDEIKYAVDNVKQLKHNEEIPENEKKGVLLVDCNNSVFIDRPVVIYLGMEQDWNKTVVGKQYLDVEDETDKNVMRLNGLIQQGNVRFYCVNSTKNGKPARPSMLFDLLYGKPADSFSLMCDHLVRGRWHKEADDIIPEIISSDNPGSDPFSGPFSKSSFNAYYSCPMKFLFSSLLTTPEEKSTEFGTLIHAFAEFYACYPDDVKELGLDHFVTLISDRYSGLSSPLMTELDLDKIRKAMATIISYLDFIGVKDVPLDTPLSKKKHPNRFMVAMGKEYTSSVCEVDVRSKDYPIHGQLDLLWDGIVSDYKTGRPHSIKDIADSMTIGPKAVYPEFQAPIYLTLMKEKDVNRGEFDLLFAMDNDVISSIEDVPVTDNMRSVKLMEGNIGDCIAEIPELKAILQEKLSRNLRDNVDDVLSCISEIGSNDPSEWDKDFGLVTNILNRLALNDNKTNRGIVESGLRKIAGYVKGGMIRTDSTLFIPQSTLDIILDEVVSSYARMVQQSTDGFPAEPRIDCKRCQYYQVCTKEVLDSGDGDE